MTPSSQLLLQIDRQRSTPVYRQIEDQLRQKIMTGELPAGSCIPNGQELSRQSGVAYRTIIRSLTSLKKQGLLRGVPSRGTFVQNGSRKLLQNIAITFDRNYQSDVVRDVERFQRAIMVASEDKFDLQLFPLRNAAIFSDEEPTLLARLLEERHIHGVITFNAPLPEDIEQLRQMNIPLVTSRDIYTVADVPWVMEDVNDGARKLVHFLTAMGHRQIALVMGSRPSKDARFRRPSAMLAEALIDHLQAGGISCRPERVAYTDFHWDRAEPVIRQWLSAPDRPTALVTVSDPWAMKTIVLAGEMGLAVPRDLSIVSYGDMSASGSMLTTIHLPIEEMARQAVDYLVEMTNDGHPVMGALPVELIVRQSCGQAPRL